MTDRVVAVALPLPVLTPFSYRVPEALSVPLPGTRVLVPFSGRRAVGFVLGPGEVPKGPLKDVLEVLDPEPLLSDPLLALASWMAEHYLAPPGECLRLFFPPERGTSRAVVHLVGPPAAAEDPLVAALGGGPLPIATLERRLGADLRSRIARLERAGVVNVEQELARPDFRRVRIVERLSDGPVKGRVQALLLARLGELGGSARLTDLEREHKGFRGAAAALGKSGRVRLTDVLEDRVPEALPGREREAPEPTKAQGEALGVVREALAARRFETVLLHGVTGSGKTEVYLRAAAETLALGRTVLFLVPEIALTPFLLRAVRERFGSEVAVVHSELGAGERHDEWWRIRQGGPRIVVGARSAVFAPLQNLGLVVVDEEHESSYKQEDSPRYHARNVAVMRARLEGAVALLGSATPSLESVVNVQKGKYRLATLPERVLDRPLAAAQVVNLRDVLRAGGDGILTPPLREALAARIARQEQALVLLNRRGYATSLLCRECGEQALCPQCSVSLTLHHGGRTALCHYCGHRQPPPPSCPTCGGEYLRLQGYGTEKVLEILQDAFPGVPMDRLDRDRVGRRGELEKILLAFEKGETRVLVGTQMIAKGHDFPGVTLVGVVDADVGLGLPDFRAAERTFALLTQVAGRAGRGDRAGEVLLQTHLPEHYALRSACAQDHQAFFEAEKEFRRTMAYPPFAALVNLVFHGAQPARTAAEAREVADALRVLAPGVFRVLGPAPAALARLRGEHREQVLLKGDRAAMRSAVRDVLTRRYGPLRWPGVVVDVDPMSVL
jgi:primosomal protein N' (replication factor Y)